MKGDNNLFAKYMKCRGHKCKRLDELHRHKIHMGWPKSSRKDETTDYLEIKDLAFNQMTMKRSGF